MKSGPASIDAFQQIMRNLHLVFSMVIKDIMSTLQLWIYPSCLSVTEMPFSQEKNHTCAVEFMSWAMLAHLNTQLVGHRNVLMDTFWSDLKHLKGGLFLDKVLLVWFSLSLLQWQRESFQCPDIDYLLHTFAFELIRWNSPQACWDTF